MNRFSRSILVICICLLFVVGIQPSAAQNAAPGEPADAGFYGSPSEHNDSESESDEVRERMEANRSLTGDLTEEIKLNAIQALERQRQLYPQLLAGGDPPAGTPAWRSLGPTQAKYETNGVTLQVSDSGRVRTILPHPADPDTLYVLTSGGGLWKTTTFTHTNPQWQAKTDALISTTGGSIAFGRNPSTLYLGIGDPFDVHGLIAGVMVKSTDGGDTWSPFVNLPGAISVRDVKVDTGGPADIVLVATDAGLYRSADGGATYTRIAAGVGQAFQNREVWSLARTSAGWLANAEDFSGVIANGVGRIFFSTDQGATWNPIPNLGNGYNNSGRTTLAVATPGEAIAYAFAANITGSTQRDLFKSTDGGLNWIALHITGKTPTNPDPCFQPNMNLMSSQAYYNQMILVDRLDGSRNTVYLGGQLATAKTMDGGTWTLLSVWLPFHSLVPACSNLPYIHADCHAAAFSSLGGRDTLFFGTDGGLFISQDGGSTWSDDKNDGIVSLLFNSVVSSTRNPQDLIGGLQDDGTRARLGSSSVFNQVVGGDGEGVGWSQANNAFALTSVPGNFYLRTEGLLPNTFDSWRSANTGIRGLDFYFFFTNVETPTAVADPTGSQFFTFTGWRVYKTANGAGSWSVIGEAGVSPGLRPKQAGGVNRAIFRGTHHGIGIGPLDTDHIVVAELTGILALTANGGSSWTERDLIALVPGYGGFNTSPVWATDDTLYLSSENPNANAIRLLKSTDGGATWSVAQNGLPDAPINRIAVDPRDPSRNTIYAATWIGVYRTTNGGANWSRFGAGLPNVDVSDIYIPPDGSFLRVSTYGRGVWEITP